MKKLTNYICKYGLYHDKPCVDREPSSNNGWIYTAFAKALGHVTMGNKHYQELCSSCYPLWGYDFIRTRLPNKKEPPISRDEAIGMMMFGTHIDFALNLYDWSLSKVDTSHVSLITSIKALWNIRNEHRNYVWENRIIPAYKLAFKILPHDRYFFKHQSITYSPTIFEWIMFQLYCITTLCKRNNTTGKVSAKNVLWLQLHSMHSVFWIKLINQPKLFRKYFGDDHIFVK